MLLSCGKQHGNEVARICDLSTPPQARTAVEFIADPKVSNKKAGLQVNSVSYYNNCNRRLPSMMCTAQMDSPS